MASSSKDTNTSRRGKTPITKGTKAEAEKPRLLFKGFNEPLNFLNKKYINIQGTYVPISDNFPEFKTTVPISQESGALLDILFRPNDLTQRIRVLHLLSKVLSEKEKIDKMLNEYQIITNDLKQVISSQEKIIRNLRTINQTSHSYFRYKMSTDLKFRKEFLDKLPHDIKYKILIQAKKAYYQELHEYQKLIIQSKHFEWVNQYTVVKAIIFPKHNWKNYQLSYIFDRGLVKEIVIEKLDDIPSCFSKEITEILLDILQSWKSLVLHINSIIPAWTNHSTYGKLDNGKINYQLKHIWIIHQYSHYSQSPRNYEEIEPILPEEYHLPDFSYRTSNEELLFENSKVKLILADDDGSFASSHSNYSEAVPSPDSVEELNIINYMEG